MNPLHYVINPLHEITPFVLKKISKFRGFVRKNTQDIKESKNVQKKVNLTNIKDRSCSLQEINSTHYTLKKETDIQENIDRDKTESLELRIKIGEENIIKDKKSDRVFFIKNDEEKQSIIQQYRFQSPKGSIIEVLSLNDLSNLMTSVVYLENGEIQIFPGRMFSDQKIILIFDFTLLEASEIACLNDVIDTFPHFQGQFLSKYVQRIIFVHHDMLQYSFGNPGPDVWRRLENIICQNNDDNQHEEIIEKLNWNIMRITPSNKDLIHSKILDTQKMQCKKNDMIIIDFTEQQDQWHLLLFGGLSFDETGKIKFIAGQLENLQQKKCIILYNAPWENAKFIHQMATTIRENGYLANQKWVSLPIDIQWIREDTSYKEIEILKKSFLSERSCQFQSKKSTFILLNSLILENITQSTVQIYQGSFYKINPFDELLQNCSTIIFTSELPNKHWIRLFHEIQKQQQKINILTNEEQIENIPCYNIKCIFYTHQQQTLQFFEKTHHIYQITSQDQWSDLWYHFKIQSKNKLIFSQKETAIFKKLKNGEPIVFYGLENNPEIIAKIETLLSSPPFLFIQGKKILLNDFNLTLLFHEKKKADIIKQSFFWKKIISHQENDNKQMNIQVQNLVDLIKNLPQNTRQYTIYFPWDTQDFNTLLEKQIENEKKQDRSLVTFPFHIRKAIYTLLVKNYRSDENIYGFLKTKIRCLYPDKEKNDLADKYALQQWMIDHPNFNIDTIKNSFWQLSRYCPAHSFKELPNCYQDHIQEENIKNVLYYLMGAVSHETRNKLSNILNIKNDFYAKPSHYYNSKRRSCLRDALLIANTDLLQKEAISDQVSILEKKMDAIVTDDSLNEQNALLKIKKELQNFIPESLINNQFHDLPHLLLNSETHSKYYLERRLIRLAAHINSHPLIFLQGVAGSGKTHMAKSVTQTLQKIQGWENIQDDPLILSLGPETTKELLYGSEILVDIENDDQKTEWNPGPITLWAQQDNPPLLVLDEANLVKDGLLAPLIGLTFDDPQICINGKIYKLNQQHRVIMTGNPPSYSGRLMDSQIKNYMLTLYQRPLSTKTLAQCIIQPSLPSYWLEEDKEYAIQMIFILYEHYKSFLTLPLSPRDLQDILTSMKHTLSHYKNDQITKNQMNALIWQAFQETFYNSLSIEEQDRYTALDHWYQGKYEKDLSIIEGKQESFHNFLEILRHSSNIHIETEQIQQLIYQFWLFLEKQKIDHKKKKGCIIEGPAGWGKDIILDNVLNLWQKINNEKPYLRINANYSLWMQHSQKIKEAMKNGQKVVISELNILPSSFIEGLFNDILTSDTQPEFVLFATINPSSFKGREEFSDALKSRCHHIILHPLNDREIHQILQYHHKNSDLCSWLTVHYSFLSKQLKKYNSPIQLTRNDLLRCGKLLQNSPIATWKKTFSSSYSFSFFSLRLSVDIDEQIQEIDIDSQWAWYEKNKYFFQNQQKLSIWLNKEWPEPIVVKLLSKNERVHWNSSEKILELPFFSDMEKLQKTAISTLNFKPELLNDKDVKLEDDVTKKHTFYLKQYFLKNNFLHSNYRLIIENIAFVDGELKIVEIPCDQDGVDIIDHDSLIPLKNVIPEKNQELGQGIFSLSKDTWTPLPGISSNDQLLSLKCKNKIPIDIGRGKDTRQILVKLNMKYLFNTKEVEIIFLIMPDLSKLLLNPNNLPDSDIKIDENICHPIIRDYLDENIFSQENSHHTSCFQLQNIKKIPNIVFKLVALQKWCNSFSGTKNIIGKNLLEHVTNMIYVKQGVCRHTSMIYKIICEYFGIYARMVSSSSHKYIEISLDAKKTWLKVSIKGGGVDSNLEIEEFTFPSKSRDKLLNDIKCIENDQSDKKCLTREFPDKENDDKFIENVERFKNDLCETENVMYFYRKSDIVELIKHDCFFIEKLPELFHKWKKYYSIDQEKIMFFILDIILFVNHFFIDFLFNDSYKKNIFCSFMEKVLDFITKENAVFSLKYLEKLLCENSFTKKNQVIKIINDFYCQFVKKELPLLPIQIDLSDIIGLVQGHSKTLIKELSEAQINTKWSFSYKAGSIFHVERYLEKKPFFLEYQESSRKRTVLLPLFFENFGDIYNVIESVQFSYPGKFIGFNKIVSKDSIRSNFIEYFFTNIVDHLYVLVSAPIYRDRKMIVEQGCYDFHNHENAFLLYITMFRNTNAYFKHEKYRYKDLNEKKIKEISGDSHALVITADFLKKCFSEYLETLVLSHFELEEEAR